MLIVEHGAYFSAFTVGKLIPVFSCSAVCLNLVSQKAEEFRGDLVAPEFRFYHIFTSLERNSLIALMN